MLTDTKIRAAKPKPKGYRLADGGGLVLFVTPAGGKVWRQRYRQNGREQTLVIGPYPAISLADARAKREVVKRAMATGTDPKGQPEDAKPTMADTTKAWHAKNRAQWQGVHGARVLSRLEQLVLAVRVNGHTLGETPIADVTAPMILDPLRRLEARGAVEAAHRMRGYLGQVFAYGIATGACVTNPASMIQDAMAALMPPGHRPAATTIEALRDVMQKAESVAADPVARMALRLLAMTALRPGEVCGGEWTEITDLDGPEPTWTIPARRMKNTKKRRVNAHDHVVPLSRQAVGTIRMLRPLAHETLMFPAPQNPAKPLPTSTLSNILRRAGLSQVHVPHGFRASFRTIMGEALRGDSDVMELMLAHKPKGELNGAYNRTLHISRRRELAQIWADLLMDGMRPPAELLELRQK